MSVSNTVKSIQDILRQVVNKITAIGYKDEN